MLEHPWPGNVRELANTLHRALVFSNKRTIDEVDIVLDPGFAAKPAEDDTADLDWTKPSRRVSNPSKAEIHAALDRAAGNQSRAATLLGIPRKRLRDLIETCELPLPRS